MTQNTDLLNCAYISCQFGFHTPSVLFPELDAAISAHSYSEEEEQGPNGRDDEADGEKGKLRSWNYEGRGGGDGG